MAVIFFYFSRSKVSITHICLKVLYMLSSKRISSKLKTKLFFISLYFVCDHILPLFCLRLLSFFDSLLEKCQNTEMAGLKKNVSLRKLILFFLFSKQPFIPVFSFFACFFFCLCLN